MPEMTPQEARERGKDRATLVAAATALVRILRSDDAGALWADEFRCCVEDVEAALHKIHRPVVWVAMNGQAQILGVYWDKSEAFRNTKYVTGVKVQ